MSVAPKPNTIRDPAKSFFLGNLPVILEKTTLKKIQSLAPARIQHQGDASEALDWVCYTLKESAQRLWLSSSEMGGGTYIDVVTLAGISSADTNTKDCPSLPKALQPPRFNPDVHIGDTIGNVEIKFGKLMRMPNSAHYEFETKQGEWRVSGRMTLTIQDGKVIAIDISHTTSD